MTIINFLQNLSTHQPYLLYTLIFLGVLVEGELTLMAAGILTHIGILEFPVILFLCIVGAVSKTVFGYSLGEFLKKRFPHNKPLHFISRQVFALFPDILQKPFWSIFISKFIYGINHVILIFAGFMGIEYKKYFWAEFFSSIIWVIGIFFLGYGFSYAAFSITHDIRKVGIIILLGVIGFMILGKIIRIVVGIIEDYNMSIDETENS
jgi:membrane protein DedA with SNARE-associated domain